MFDLDYLIKEALERGASDIHISAGAPPAFRINGELLQSDLKEMTPGDTLEVLLKFMDPVERQIFEEKKEIDLSVSIPDAGRFRVNAYRQRGLITITLRIVDSIIPEAESLGIPKEVLRLCEARRGLILITGPSGSGRSTVTASLVDRINSERPCNIITLENPIEYIYSNKKAIVNQREIGVDAVDQLSALNSALRQDPDVIASGMINTEEEIEATIKAAETGRLVFSSLFSMGAVQTIEFMIDAFPAQKRRQAANRLSNVLRAVISRQLLHSRGNQPVPAYEILVSDNSVKEMIRENRTGEIREYMEKNSDKGLITMDDSIFSLYEKAAISPEEAVEAAFDQENMAKLCKSLERREEV